MTKPIITSNATMARIMSTTLALPEAGAPSSSSTTGRGAGFLGPGGPGFCGPDLGGGPGGRVTTSSAASSPTSSTTSSTGSSSTGVGGADFGGPGLAIGAPGFGGTPGTPGFASEIPGRATTGGPAGRGAAGAAGVGAFEEVGTPCDGGAGRAARGGPLGRGGNVAPAPAGAAGLGAPGAVGTAGRGAAGAAGAPTRGKGGLPGGRGATPGGAPGASAAPTARGGKLMRTVCLAVGFGGRPIRTVAFFCVAGAAGGLGASDILTSQRSRHTRCHNVENTPSQVKSYSPVRSFVREFDSPSSALFGRKNG